MSDEKLIFARGEVYINPDDHLMMVTEVSLMDCGLYRIDYVTEEGAQGWFDTDEKAIMNNIELYDQPSKTAPTSNEALEALERLSNAYSMMSASEHIFKDVETIRQALAQPECSCVPSSKYTHGIICDNCQKRGGGYLVPECVEVETLQEELEEVIMNTHDIDVQDKHYAANIIDHLLKHHKGKVIK